MTKIRQAKIVLLRHGQCQGGNILRGKIDVELTEQGFAKMRSSIQQLDFKPHWPQIQVFSSPLNRCSQFAEQLLSDLREPSVSSSSLTPNPNDNLSQGDGLTLPALQLMPELAEIDFGDWDGLSFERLYAEFGDSMNQYWQNPWQHTPPNAETMQHFEQRVASGFYKACNQLRQWINQLELDHLPQKVSQQSQEPMAIIVTHGGVIRAIISLVLGLKQCRGIYDTLAIEYAATVSISLFWVDEEKEPKFRLHW
ncbi:histidine phosphatase family protein [Vibrio rarus]|uniref:histidine phosphatase family protein n=1 Tax=Vibrio rarus TaxID=413403 RepID=UPI0021C4C8A1|nr:histidine phosphatase family protein [Vibrio rarus]